MPGLETLPGEESFELMIEKLEGIVANMENAELPLDQLLVQYEQGMKLVKLCGDKLNKAEQVIEVLSKPATGL